MPNRVLLDDKLRCNWSAKAQRKRSGLVQLFVCECANCLGSVAAIPAEEIQCLKFINRRMLARVPGVHFCDGFPGYIGNWLARRDCARKLDLDRVYACHMMNHRADRTHVGW